MIGCDTSHHNKFWIKEMDCWDFQIHKITEGCNFTDPDAETWSKVTKNKLRGVYHFVKPACSIEAECDRILTTMEELELIGNTVLILDYEYAGCDSQNHIDRLAQLIKLIQIRLASTYRKSWQPIIYANKTTARAIANSPLNSSGRWIAANSCLWLACYQEHDCRKSSCHVSWAPIMRQFSTAGGTLDLDIFYGSPESWNRLARM